MQYLIFAGLALLSSAANTIFNRISANKIGTLVSAVIKALFIVFATFIITLCFGNIDKLFALTGDQWLWVIILGLVTCVDWIFYFLSIKRAHLEAFSPYEASAVLFLSNTLFMIFEFSVVTKNNSPLNTVLFFAGLACLLGAMIFAVTNKKINPSTKKIWIFYATVTALAMAFTLVIVKYHLSEVPSSIVSFYQMIVVFVVCGILMFAFKAHKEFKTIRLIDYGKFFIAAIFNALLMVFRYMALTAENSSAPIVNCIIALDFVLVSLATVLFFKAKNKLQLTILLVIVTTGMILNVVAQLI